MANIVQYLASLFRAGEKKRREVRRTTEGRTPKVYKTNTSNEDVYKIMNISRLPLKQQRDYYTKVEPKLGEKVVKDTQKAFEDNPFQAGFMEALAPVSALNTVKEAVGKDIDVSKAQETPAYKVGQVAGLVGQFATTGGIAQQAVAKGLVKGAPSVAKQFLAERGADVLTGTPLNIAEAIKQGGTAEDKAKNIAFNTALDLATGTAIGTVAPAVAKLFKSKEVTTAVKEGTDALVKSGDLPPESVDVIPQALKTVQERAKNRKLKEGTTPVQEFKGEIPTRDIYLRKNDRPEAAPPIFKDEKVLFDDYETGEAGTLGVKITQIGDKYYLVNWDWNGLHGRPMQLTKNRAELIAKDLKSGSGESYLDALSEYSDKYNSEISKLKIEKVPLDSSTVKARELYAKRSGGTLSPDDLTFDRPIFTKQFYDNLILGDSSYHSTPKPQEFKGEIPQSLEPKIATIDDEIAKATEPKVSTKKQKPLPNATVLEEMPDEKRVNLLRKIVDDVRLRGVDTFTPWEDYARSLLKSVPDTGNKLLYKINKARNASQIANNWVTFRQTDASGINNLGKSLTEIKDMIPESKVADFQNFLFLRHHLDRLKQGKPIFSTKREETVSRIQAIFENLTDAEKKMFNDADIEIRNYIKNLRNYAKDTGLLTQKQIDLFENLYPNYIKTVRASGDDFVGMGDGSQKVRDIYKAASRSEDPILPLWNQLEILTRDTVETGNINDLMREIYKARYGEIVGVKPKTKGVSEDMFSPPELSVVGGKHNIKFYNEGKVVSMPVTPLEAKSFKILTGGGIMNSAVAQAMMKYINPLNRWFKLPITGVNPIFLLKNLFRDTTDGLFYSKRAQDFIKNYPRAVQELTSKGEYYQLWQASGGRYSSYFNLDANLRDKRTWFTKTISERIENANALVESAPRMAEFMSIVDRLLDGKPLSEITEDILNAAVYGSAEITTNFGRGGDIGKLLNSTVAPFFNPSVQGSSRLVRQLSMHDGFRAFMPIIAKAAVLGMVPAVLNEMVYGNDEEYQMLPDRYKLTNYVFKIGDTWIRIPRGRVLSVLGMLPQNIIGKLKGDDYDFAELIKVAGGQVAPINPFESNLFSPIIGAAKNETWYGGPIDGQAWDNVKKSDHYDATTSEIGKLLGSFEFSPFKKNLNLSPKQWDYIINSYTGIFGDVLLPATTGKQDVAGRITAGAEAFPRAFTLDPTFQNDLSKEFYELYDKYTIIPADPTTEEKLTKRFMERYRSKTSEITQAIKDIQNGNLPSAMKEQEVEELRTQLNNMYKNAEFEVQEFQNFLDDSIKKYGEEGGYSNSVIKSAIEAGEDEWVAYTSFMQGNKKDNYEVAKNAGVKAEDYYNLFDGRLDTDGSGGVTQEEAMSVLDSMGFTQEQKGALWGIINKGWKSNPYTGGTISTSKSKASVVAKAYRDGLATKQVQALKDLNLSTPTLSTAELKAIIKMLSA